MMFKREATENSPYERIIKNFSNANSFIIESESRLNGFCMAFRKKPECDGLTIAIIIYYEDGTKRYYSELTVNGECEGLEAYDRLKVALPDGAEACFDVLDNLNIQHDRLSTFLKNCTKDARAAYEKQKLSPENPGALECDMGS